MHKVGQPRAGVGVEKCDNNRDMFLYGNTWFKGEKMLARREGLKWPCKRDILCTTPFEI